MKYLLPLLLLLIRTGSYAQQVRPAKGDNLIEITSSLPDSALYKIVGRTLVDAGYTFRSDREFGTFKTDERALINNSGYLLIHNISVSQGKIKFRALLRNLTITGIARGSIADPGLPVEYRSNDMTMYRTGYLQMADIANRVYSVLPGSVISSKRQ